MRQPISSILRTAAAILLTLGIALTLVAVGAYFSIFGPRSGYALSLNDSAWSNFGSYIGGVLGPIFSFFAFAGVLLTVWLQAKQLDTSHAQANFEEIQRVLSNISAHIDNLLAQPPNQHIENHRLRNAPITVFTVVSGAGSAALATPSDYMLQASNSRLITEAKSAIQTEVAAIALDLEQLAWCLQEYRQHGGSTIVTEFYKRRYNAIVCWLDALGELESHHRVQAYFAPKDFRKCLTP